MSKFEVIKDERDKVKEKIMYIYDVIDGETYQKNIKEAGVQSESG